MERPYSSRGTRVVRRWCDEGAQADATAASTRCARPEKKARRTMVPCL